MKFIEWLKSLFKKAEAPKAPLPKPAEVVVIKDEPKPLPVSESEEHLKRHGFNRASVMVGSDVIPFAVPHPRKKMKTKGSYRGGWPSGAVVHYTAGRDHKGKAFSTIEGAKDYYAYLCIDIDGTIVQAHPVSKWGYHAGESGWRGLIGGMNDDLIGIEINNPGKLDEKGGKLFSWYGEEVSKADARYVTKDAYGCPTGWYKKYSKEQEDALIRVIAWLYYSCPKAGHFKIDNVVGHHEVAGPLGGLKGYRKSDPGGSLWLPMPEFRNYLKKIL